MLAAFRRRYGDEILETVEQTYYEMGTSEGLAEKEQYGSLLNKLVDIYVRPYSYENEQLEMTEERMCYQTLRCPFADMVMDMGLEELGKHLCPPWHKGYGEFYGYRWSGPKLLFDGDNCCYHIWEKAG